jgi:hypothetical protein
MAEYGHNLFYSRLGHITVPTLESGVEAAPEIFDAFRRERAEAFLEDGRETLARGENLLICPEGRSQRAQDSPARFKSGAFRLALYADEEPYIVPIAVAGFDRRYKEGRLVAIVQTPFKLTETMASEGYDNLRDFLDDYRLGFANAVAEARELCGDTLAGAPATTEPA